MKNSMDPVSISLAFLNMSSEYSTSSSCFFCLLESSKFWESWTPKGLGMALNCGASVSES